MDELRGKEKVTYEARKKQVVCKRRGTSKGVNRNGMYSDAMRVAAMPIFKLTYRTLCEYSSSLTHFIRRFSRRHRMAVTRETQGQEDTHTCGLERTMQLLRSDKLPKRSKGTYVSSMLHVILSRVCVRKVEAQGVESWVAKSPERLC
jgi:hypothetical protein